MPQSHAAGYLADFEASHLVTQAIPGAIVLKLRRAVPEEIEAGRPMRQMFIELSLSEAVAHWQHMAEQIRAAGALARQPSHADAVTLL